MNLFEILLQLHSIYVYVHPLAVPAVYKEPDIRIFKSNNTEESVLIERDREYNATWDPEILNINEFNETGNITLDFQNWIFGLSNNWIDRKKRPTTSQDFLKIISNKTTKGIITFKQNIRRLNLVTFDISVLVLIKKTKNLKINYVSTFVAFLPDPPDKGFCQTWHNTTKETLAPTDVSSCPCNMKSTIFDDDFEFDPTCSVTKTECHENVYSNHCYLRKIIKGNK